MKVTVQELFGRTDRAAIEEMIEQINSSEMEMISGRLMPVMRPWKTTDELLSAARSGEDEDQSRASTLSGPSATYIIDEIQFVEAWVEARDEPTGSQTSPETSSKLSGLPSALPTPYEPGSSLPSRTTPTLARAAWIEPSRRG